ncbi:MAG: 30S ribosomal protein S6 [Pseudomonadota bacterium]
MPLYEHVFIARQDISGAQAEALIEHLGQIITDNGGAVAGTEYWGLKTLAYKINKNRKGHYGFLRTDAPAPAILEMERLARLHDDVMRVMSLRVDVHGEGPSAMLQSKSSRDDRRGDRRGRDDDRPRREDDRPRRDDDRRRDDGPRRDDAPRREDA